MSNPASEAALLASAGALDASTLPAKARFALSLLERCAHGRLDLHLPDGQRASYGAGEPMAAMRLANWNVIGAALSRGDIGFAESYVAGDWDSPDIARVLTYFLRNRDAAEAVIYGSFWGGLLARVKHLLNRNTRRQARRNIQEHYDLGNAFYALWLDPTMTYSSALFANAHADAHAPASLDEMIAGQHAKYARVLDELRLAPGARVLEIGCGWGGLAEAAARRGMQLKGLTLSPAQLDFAQRRLSGRGLSAELVLQDYRDERGTYDGVASIEMFEAVGEEYWPSYFETVARSLKPGGRACIQTIEIRDDLFERYRRSTDFIQQYIFPGGMLPSPSVFRAQAERAGLEVVERHAFGRDYARTLATWRRSFHAALPAVRQQGFDERFVRIWDFYLAYCEAAFAEGNTDVAQVTLVRR